MITIRNPARRIDCYVDNKEIECRMRAMTKKMKNRKLVVKLEDDLLEAEKEEAMKVDGRPVYMRNNGDIEPHVAENQQRMKQNPS